MSFSRYEAALTCAAIEHSIIGSLSRVPKEEASSASLFPIWKDALMRVLPPADLTKFLSLSTKQQQTFYPPTSPFAFERFQRQFLASARKHRSIRLH